MDSPLKVQEFSEILINSINWISIKNPNCFPLTFATLKKLLWQILPTSAGA